MVNTIFFGSTIITNYYLLHILLPIFSRRSNIHIHRVGLIATRTRDIE